MARPDRIGPHRVAFEKNKKIILKTQNICGICGKPVDTRLKHPHPLSPVTREDTQATSITSSSHTGHATERNQINYSIKHEKSKIL